LYILLVCGGRNGPPRYVSRTCRKKLTPGNLYFQGEKKGKGKREGRVIGSVNPSTLEERKKSDGAVLGSSARQTPGAGKKRCNGRMHTKERKKRGSFDPIVQEKEVEHCVLHAFSLPEKALKIIEYR